MTAAPGKCVYICTACAVKDTVVSELIVAITSLDAILVGI